MDLLTSLPISGKLIIAIILLLFFMAIIMLVVLKLRYQSLSDDVNLVYHDSSQHFNIQNPAIEVAIKRYKSGYLNSGTDINTPAIVESALEDALRGSFIVERFLNATVSLLITLGLLGTFLGLTMAVSDLASMFAGSSEDIMATLEIVGSGLLSSLSGMGVAFTTSLVGISCSIMFTILSVIVSPTKEKERFLVSLEDFLDNVLSPRLKTQNIDDNTQLVKAIGTIMKDHAQAVAQTLDSSSKMLEDTVIWLNTTIKEFGNTCSTFNENVRDFSEFNHNLRNNIERMDVNFMKLIEFLRENRK